MTEPEMSGAVHQLHHPPSWDGTVSARLDGGKLGKLYIDQADQLVIISDVLLAEFLAGESPFVTVSEPDVVVLGLRLFTVTITAENGIFVYRGSVLPCGCMAATLQDQKGDPV